MDIYTNWGKSLLVIGNLDDDGGSFVSLPFISAAVGTDVGWEEPCQLTCNINRLRVF